MQLHTKVDASFLLQLALATKHRNKFHDAELSGSSSGDDHNGELSLASDRET